MKKAALIFFIFLCFLFPKSAFAQTNTPSALFSVNTCYQNAFDVRTLVLQTVFARYNSPLFAYAPLFVKYADIYGIDWRLLPAISGNESVFGTIMVDGTYNAYGWDGGYLYFDSWDNGIKTVIRNLRENYINSGQITIATIGNKYAEDPQWAEKVSFYIDEIQAAYISQKAIDPIQQISL